MKGIEGDPGVDDTERYKFIRYNSSIKKSAVPIFMIAEARHERDEARMRKVAEQLSLSDLLYIQALCVSRPSLRALKLSSPLETLSEISRLRRGFAEYQRSG